MIQSSVTMEIITLTCVMCLIFFCFTLLSSINLSLYHCATFGNETDKLALLAFKDRITHDPFGALSSWNDSLHFCHWHGVICSHRHGRVKALDLRNQNLTGTISPYIGNLTVLKGISLENNDFHGNIPQEIGRLFRLEVIVFRQNSLQGEIPINLTQCSKLRILELFMNKLVGNIPIELGTLSNLVGLGLSHNKFTGSIPQSLSNLTSLKQLSLSENSFSGHIPSELGQLSKLEMFQLSSNRFLTGSVPIQLFNISSLNYFAVAENRLSGVIPPYIGQSLPNLRVLLLGYNEFTGPIPHSITNASRLETLDFSANNFTGSIPVNLGSLKNLIKLNLAKNNLGNGKSDDLSFINSLVNCTSMEVLSMSFNNLTGVFPNKIANLSSHLSFLTMGANWISGSIPTGIENLKNLIEIGMEENLLTDIIPNSIGNLLNLQVLSLFGNKFSGEIPASLGNVSFLTELSLGNNTIQGNIPSSLGNCHNLQKLSLWGNNLSGTIPRQVIGLPSLSEWLDLSQNHLTGLIPSEIGNLRSIQLLDLSNNNLSGEIPNSLENCNSMESLLLGGNFFRGPIPLSLSSLKGIQDLDLSRNNFSGKIPNFLRNFTFLRNLNLSFNNLEGEVPKEGIFKNASAVAIIGNENLCGGVPEFHLQTCSIEAKKHLPLYIIILIVCSGICLISVCFFAILCWKRMSTTRKPSVESPLNNKYLQVSYAELLKATDGFSSANLVGVGSFGSVYKGFLGQEETALAVKVFNLQQTGASKSFLAECEALRCIRHRNLVKIFTSCSSVDFRGNEFKALVFDFMPNGSLEKWLYQEAHEQNQYRHLNLMQRLSIAIDVAHALDYLHHHCDTPIVHCDLKPSNVLLDHDMKAQVGDFGLARFLINRDSQNPTSSSRLKGSIGYVAPEYGVTGKASTEGDVYSYGILLLEMFTGKRPTDDMFKDGLSLHTFAKMAIPDRVVEVADPKIVEEAVANKDPNVRNKLLGSLTPIFRTGVLCSTELPRKRMNMKDAVMELQAIRLRETLIGVKIQ